MSLRDPVLQRLLDALARGFAEALGHDPTRSALAEGFFQALESPGAARAPTARRLPACAHFAAAIERNTSAHALARSSGAGGASPATCASVALSLATLEPRLGWYRRIGSEAEADGFHDGHANAWLIGGPDGLESCDRAALGLSLLAPGTRYPDHAHPPEELYFVLSAGWWRNEATPWFEPGRGGTVHNAPGTRHAMRSGSHPLLAVWCLL